MKDHGIPRKGLKPSQTPFEDPGIRNIRNPFKVRGSGSALDSVKEAEETQAVGSLFKYGDTRES
jgi:hypothetical protein